MFLLSPKETELQEVTDQHREAAEEVTVAEVEMVMLMEEAAAADLALLVMEEMVPPQMPIHPVPEMVGMAQVEVDAIIMDPAAQAVPVSLLWLTT